MLNWNDNWIEQAKNPIIELEQDNPTPYPFFISPFFQQHIAKLNYPKSLTRQFYPNLDENDQKGFYDPIGDIKNNQADKLVHRYKNRVLITPTTNCPVNCRYCFRKNTLAAQDEMFKGLWKNTLSYLNQHSEIDEVIFTGGDPLMLSNKKIDNYLNDLSQIKHIKYIRFHSRTPIIIPQRIDEGFIKLIKNYENIFKKIILVIHTNHSDEISEEFKVATDKLHNCKIELLAQSVLLKDVNDDVLTLINLFTNLSDLGIRPYYLHHPDQVKGGMHFYLSLKTGRKIYAGLRNLLPGWMIPQYVVDIQNGEGKVPAFNPEAFDFNGLLINKNAQLTHHLEDNK